MSQKSDKPRLLELLAPARDCDIARQAIDHGADAVYIGAEAFGARVAAANSVEDIASLTDYAHSFDARVYVTVNTLVYDNELAEAERLIRRLYRAGVDALIVQDLGLLRMDLPPIALHASTQCDTRTPAKARFLEDCGFSQIVLARELSLDEIRAIASDVTVPLEAFVHGALCVSYSGDCQASLLATGRSANRGECAQMCRLPYRLTDASGRQLAPEAHYLSLRDMCRIDRLGDMADAGVSSFKIEGRLKDSVYVRNVVAAYSRALDDVCARSGGRYRRASSGRVTLDFEPDVERTFNRRYTNYFLDGGNRRLQRGMSSADSPKWIGMPVATVTGSRGAALTVKADIELHNGDGLGWFDASRRFNGFRLNRMDGNEIYPATRINIPAGTRLYRNRDKVFDEQMSRSTATRVIDTDIELREAGRDRIAMRLTDRCGNDVTATVDSPYDVARGDQTEQRRRVVSRLGDTIYRAAGIDDSLGDRFVAASVLTALRRRAVSLLDETRRMRYAYDYRRPESAEIKPFKDAPLDYHDNVANRLAERFFADHGIDVAARALECQRPAKGAETRVMTTRYCLRRELGACLKDHSCRGKYPSTMYLENESGRMRLDFDCANCEMHVVKVAGTGEFC